MDTAVKKRYREEERAGGRFEALRVDTERLREAIGPQESRIRFRGWGAGAAS